MHPRVTHALYLLLVALLLQSAPAGAEAGLPVLEPVGVSGYQGEEGQGLRLTFKRLRPDPALAQWTNIVYLRDHKGPHPRVVRTRAGVRTMMSASCSTSGGSGRGESWTSRGRSACR
jgi:hypothetical protein